MQIDFIQNTTNRIGKRGESIFSTIITRYIQPSGYYFDPIFLGEKFPVVDFYIDLLNYFSKKGFFFASVKSTKQGYNRDKSKLKIIVDKDEIKTLNSFPVPVYIFGIDEKEENGFFICANKLSKSKNMNGIHTSYPIDEHNLKKLWKEVADYWDGNNEITKFVSSFN